MIEKPDTVFKAMADPTRRRILQILAQHELSVTELVQVLRQPQSTVSRHLKTLRDAELIAERRNGTTIYHTPASAAPHAAGESLAAELLQWVSREPLPPALGKRTRSIVARRKPDTDGFFERVGGRWDQMRRECFGDSFHWEALAALVPREWVVADVGTGTGYLLPTLAAMFERVIAVEPVPAMMEIARGRPELAATTHIDFRIGDLGRLPIGDTEVDLAITMLVLHHVAEPPLALAELARITKPGGRLLVVEQKPHHFETFHTRMSDLWWGFDPQQLAAQARAAGFDDVRQHHLAAAAPDGDAVQEAPELFALTACKN